MEAIGCIFCKNRENDARIVIEENGFTGRKCSHCGLIYISPRPTLAEIINLYGHDQAHASAESHFRASFVKRLHARHSLPILERHKKRGALLEIGAGAGYFLEEARKAGFDVYGIELNPIQADFINRKLNIPCETMGLTESYDGKTFDVIYHCDVISHFFDPILEFREMNDRLNSDGILMFETGNLGDVEEKYFAALDKFQYPDHLFFFGEENLRTLLEITGFELIVIYRYSILYQLRTIRLLAKLQGKINKLCELLRGSNDNAGIINTRIMSDFSELALNSFLHFLRYKVGYILPKKGRPQTVIVVAGKSRRLPNMSLHRTS